MSDIEYCRLCDSPVVNAYESYCKAHDAEDEITQLERQLTEAREVQSRSIIHTEFNLTYVQALNALTKADSFYNN